MNHRLLWFSGKVQLPWTDALPSLVHVFPVVTHVIALLLMYD